MKFLISGYGGESGDTAGVFSLVDNRFIWNCGIPSISYMCASDSYILGAGEHSSEGYVYLFSKQDSDYRLLDTLRIPGGLLCHIAYSKKHNILTGACYENGDVFSVAIDKDKFGKMHSYFTQRDGEKLSRAHSTVFSTDERYVYSANIALDRIYRYEVIDGVLVGKGIIQLPIGVGPRHLVQSDDKLYVITEYSNEIITLNDDMTSNILSRVSTLPDGYVGTSYCSTLTFSEQGFLYAANRGANTIAVFGKAKDGKLTKLHNCSCFGDWPRHISVINGDKDVAQMLAIANQNSGKTALAKINDNGSLGDVLNEISFEGASYVSALV